MLTRPRTTNPTAIAIPTTPESTCITRHGPGCGFLSSRIALLCHCSEPKGSFRTDNCLNIAIELTDRVGQFSMSDIAW